MGGLEERVSKEVTGDLPDARCPMPDAALALQEHAAHRLSSMLGGFISKETAAGLLRHLNLVAVDMSLVAEIEEIDTEKCTFHYDVSCEHCARYSGARACLGSQVLTALKR